MTFYSQHGEDVLLAEIFKNDIGICVEVGANDGVTYSNTKYLEEHGWTCILVEPTPRLCEKIRKTRSGQLFECAATDTDGEITLYISEEHDLFSSVEKQATMMDELARSKLAILPVKVAARRLDSILVEAGVERLDMVSIDVEGHEYSVLKGFDLERFNPRIMLIEDSTDLQVSMVEKYLMHKGYHRFYRSGGNDWYARRGEIRTSFISRMLMSGKMEIRGWAKVIIPRQLLRLLLQLKRKL